MTDPVHLAAAELADVLEAENAALRSMDLPRAIAQVPLKEARADRLRLALSGIGPERSGRPPETLVDSRAMATRLQALAVENRRLLERAIGVQGRLIAILARAAPLPPIGYGDAARRGTGNRRSMAPMALCARA